MPLNFLSYLEGETLTVASKPINLYLTTLCSFKLNEQGDTVYAGRTRDPNID